MRKILILGLFLTGCSLLETKPTKLTEPDRTGFYVQCLMSGLDVTTCECYETKTVEKTGMIKIATPEDAKIFVAVISDISKNEECTKKEEDKKE